MKAEQEIQRNENKIAAEALTDPKQAITDAMALPEIRQSLFFAEGTSPRARVLLAIAKEIGKKNPNATVDALSRAQVSGPDRWNSRRIYSTTQRKNTWKSAMRMMPTRRFAKPGRWRRRPMRRITTRMIRTGFSRAHGLPRMNGDGASS